MDPLMDDPAASSATSAPDESTAGAAAQRRVLTRFRSELVARNDDVVGADWAGAVPAQYGVAPRVRIGSSKWFNLLCQPVRPWASPPG